MNLREHVKAITFRSGKELAEPEKGKEDSSTETMVEPTKGKKYEIPMKCNKGIEEEKKISTHVAPPTYDHPIPYPQRVKQQKKDQREK